MKSQHEQERLQLSQSVAELSTFVRRIEGIRSALADAKIEQQQLQVIECNVQSLEMHTFCIHASKNVIKM